MRLGVRAWYQSWRRRRWQNREPGPEWQAKLDFDALSDTETALVGQCLLAAADGPFFPDWEFNVLLGLDREAVRSIAQAWPEIGNRRTAELAVNNALNNLVGYPHGCEAEWSAWIDESPDDLLALLAKLTSSTPGNYFEAII